MIYKVGYWIGRLVCGLDKALESLRDGFTAGRFYGEPGPVRFSLNVGNAQSAESVSEDLRKAFQAKAPGDPRGLLVTPESPCRDV